MRCSDTQVPWQVNQQKCETAFGTELSQLRYGCLPQPLSLHSHLYSHINQPISLSTAISTVTSSISRSLSLHSHLYSHINQSADLSLSTPISTVTSSISRSLSLSTAISTVTSISSLSTDYLLILLISVRCADLNAVLNLLILANFSQLMLTLSSSISICYYLDFMCSHYGELYLGLVHTLKGNC